MYLLCFAPTRGKKQVKKETVDVVEDDFRFRMADAERQRYPPAGVCRVDVYDVYDVCNVCDVWCLIANA